MYINGMGSFNLFTRLSFHFHLKTIFAKDAWRVDEEMGLMNSMENRIPDEGRHYEHHIHNFWSSKARRKKLVLKLNKSRPCSVIFFSHLAPLKR